MSAEPSTTGPARWMHPESARRGGLVVDLLAEAEHLLGPAMVARWVSALMQCHGYYPDAPLWELEVEELARIHRVVRSIPGESARRARLLETIEKARRASADLADTVASVLERAAPDGATPATLTESAEDALAAQLERLAELLTAAELAPRTADEWCAWRLYTEGADEWTQLGAPRVARLCQWLERLAPQKRREVITQQITSARERATEQLCLLMKQARGRLAEDDQTK